MKLFKGLLVLALVMTLATAFAQTDVDTNDATRTSTPPAPTESATIDAIDLNVVVECVRLIDAYTTGANNITLAASDLTNAGGLWAKGDNTLEFLFDYTTNCTSGNVAGTQQITLEMAALPSGLTADIISTDVGTDNGSITGAAVGTAANATDVGGATNPIVTGIQNVSATGGKTTVDLYGFAQVNTGEDIVLTFTLAD